VNTSSTTNTNEAPINNSVFEKPAPSNAAPKPTMAQNDPFADWNITNDTKDVFSEEKRFDDVQKQSFDVFNTPTSSASVDLSNDDDNDQPPFFKKR
ncbi:MAG: cell division protein FtsZ, partial [Leuconostoc mesenteroides]